MSFKDMLLVLVRPDCWIRNYHTNKIWDKALNIQLDNAHLRISEYDKQKLLRGGKLLTITLNDRSIWVGNYPYAYGSDNSTNSDELPSRATVFRLRRGVTKAIKGIKQELQFDENHYINNW